jgi:hypothetical protein
MDRFSTTIQGIVSNPICDTATKTHIHQRSSRQGYSGKDYGDEPSLNLHRSSQDWIAYDHQHIRKRIQFEKLSARFNLLRIPNDRRQKKQKLRKTNPAAGRPNAPVGFLRQYGTTVTRKHFLPMQRQALLLILATLMASSAATAQAPPTPATPPAQTAPPAPPRNATGCAPTQSMPQQGTIAPQGTTTTDQQAEPLSDKLARSDGVLCPPTGVDPEIRAPTPETGNMPVIPPPGSPGGDPTIRPK